MAHAGGRPTKYTPELLKKCWEYVETWRDDGEEVIPTFAGLACFVHISVDTVTDWSKDPDKTEFFRVTREIQAEQHKILVAKGLLGEFNPNITKLILTKHGYSDRQQTEVSGNIDQTWRVELINADDTAAS